jgi:hypothetical protein
MSMLVLLGPVACGADSAAGDSAMEVVTGGGQPEDLAMATDVQRYFKRNARERPWFSEVESIVVEDGVITVNTTLDLGEPSGQAGAVEICAYIQGSDVADFTPGHTIRGEREEQIVCPCRRPPGSDPAPDDDPNADDVCRLE